MTGREFLEKLQNHKHIDESIEFIIGEFIHKDDIDVRYLINSYFAKMELMRAEYEKDLEHALRIIHNKNYSNNNLYYKEQEFVDKYEKKFNY